MKVNDKMSYVGKLTLYKALFFTEDKRPPNVEHEDDWSTADVNFREHGPGQYHQDYHSQPVCAVAL